MSHPSSRVASYALLLPLLYLTTCPYWVVMLNLQDYPHVSAQWPRLSMIDLGQQSNPITPLNIPSPTTLIETPSPSPTTPTETPTSSYPVETPTPAGSLRELQESLKSLEDRRIERYIGLIEALALVVGLVAVCLTIVGIVTAYSNIRATTHIRDDEKRARARMQEAQQDITERAELTMQGINEAQSRIAGQVTEVQSLHRKYFESLELFVSDVERTGERTGGILYHLMDVLDMLVDNSALSEEDKREAYQKIGLTRSNVEYTAHLVNLQSIDKNRRRSALFYFDRHGAEEVIPYIRSVIEDPQEDPALKEIAKQAIKDIIERAGAVESGKEKES